MAGSVVQSTAPRQQRRLTKDVLFLGLWMQPIGVTSDGLRRHHNV